MKNTIRIIAIIALFTLCIGALGCANNEKKSREYADFCRIGGRNFYFLSDREKESLREPLIALLSNETKEIYADTARGEIIGFEPYDPNAPTIPEGYRCGLYDVSGDGIPELLVHPRGFYGSSGTVTYFVYDVFTGKKIGEMDGANAELWCVYYFLESDELHSVGTYWRRGGWQERYRVMTVLEYDPISQTCHETYGLYAHLGIDKYFDREPPEGEIDEFYPYAYYSVEGENAYLDEYYDALDRFHATTVRIPETKLQMISWSDVSEENDDRFARAEKMADALLTSSQKFILPEQ